MSTIARWLQEPRLTRREMKNKWLENQEGKSKDIFSHNSSSTASRCRCEQRIEESDPVGVSWSYSSRTKCTIALQLWSVRRATLQRKMVSRNLRVLQIHSIRTSGRENILLQHRHQSWRKFTRLNYVLPDSIITGEICNAREISDGNSMHHEYILRLCEFTAAQKFTYNVNRMISWIIHKSGMRLCIYPFTWAL